MSGALVQIGEGPRGFSHRRLPPHCVRRGRVEPEVDAVQRRLRRSGLHSVCEQARCPNRSECWSRRHVAFMLLGSVCTRACRFCAVTTGRPPSGPDPEEPENVARLAAELGLAHVVLTSVDRDDLADGGAAQFAATVRAIRARRPEASVEVLTPDFRGDLAAVATVCESAPDVYNHNVETVPRLYRRARPGAAFARSLAVLAEAKRLRWDSLVKSGLMVGLGETLDEIVELLRALRGAGVDTVTIGQYLRPTRRHLPVERYWEPAEFDALAGVARDVGFAHVACGPLVRSSFGADESFAAARARRVASDAEAGRSGTGALR
jgi:lipoic acid synthetase